MPTRLLLDGTFVTTPNYYQTFPTEPIVKPDGDLDVRVPVEKADRINPISLLALLTRMAALPGTERQLLIVTHGNEDGLGFRLAPGTEELAEDIHLNSLTVMGKVLQKTPDILRGPLDGQPDAFATLFKSVKNLDGSAIFPEADLKKLLEPEKGDVPDTSTKKQGRLRNAVATFQAILEWVLDTMANRLPNQPINTTTSGTVFQTGLNRRQLDELLKRGNEVRGRFDRIDFRGCNIGQKTKVLEAVRAFFGCQQACAPDVLSFDVNVGVEVDRDFDKHLDRNIEALTKRRAVAGLAPVKLDKATGHQQTYPPAQIPMTRRFDTDKARSGDEVFIRMWITQIEPNHSIDMWMRVISIANAERFVQDKIDPDISHWKIRTSLPLSALWLVDDFNTPPPIVVTVNPTGGVLDPVATTPPPAPFALPRDPEYRQHLICVP